LHARGESIYRFFSMHSRPLLRSLPLRPLFSSLALAVLALLLPACGKPAKEAAKGADAGLASVEQRVSYGIGYNMGANLIKQTEFKVDPDAVKAGITDGLAGTKARLSESELQAAFTTAQQRAAAAAAVAGEKQLAAAKVFLEQNRTRSGVTVTASGLQYEVLTHGKGAKPKPTDTVEVHYHGTLLDGTVFDSSVERGTPATFRVNGVIPGWTEALQLMSVGDKWKLYIPAALAYGPRAAGKIPANSALIFEVELRAIK
jgi:FKBP-type peptidyl-prolyl cis-trans isomerase FklB